MSNKLLLLVFTLMFLAGCWGPEFQAASAPVPEDASTTGTGGSAGEGPGTETATSGAQATSGDAGSTTGISTTGSDAGGATGGIGGSSGETSTSTGAGGTVASSTTGDVCAPPSALPELGGEQVWQDYEEEHQRLCMGGSALGTVRCVGEPCGEFSLPVEVEPWSEDGLVYKVTYKPMTAPFEVLLECGSDVSACEYTMNLDRAEVFFLELTPSGKSGFKVKAFYADGEAPTQDDVALKYSAGYPSPVPEECRGISNATILVEDFWSEYVERVRGLTWGCNE